MGKKSREKRERREHASYVASLTHCEGTWLEHPPSAEELTRIQMADKMLRGYRLEAMQLGANQEEFNKFSLAVYRDERWAPLYLEDWLIEGIIAEHGEPPVVEDESDPSFSTYLLRALGSVASARFRRAMAEQSRRFLPQLVQEGKIKEALAVEHNAYMTVMSDAATPLLVQTLVGGLARYYDELEVDEPVVED
ncbi:MAG TPA: hypothetical protein VNL77_18570 [Roseiflexaceae bacterium]|nr:hypothetical protein [Roseiflexaceae bacterium]